MLKFCSECGREFEGKSNDLWCSRCRKKKDAELIAMGIDINPKQPSIKELTARYNQLLTDFSEVVCDRNYCLDEIDFRKREAKRLKRILIENNIKDTENNFRI